MWCWCSCLHIVVYIMIFFFNHSKVLYGGSVYSSCKCIALLFIKLTLYLKQTDDSCSFRVYIDFMRSYFSILEKNLGDEFLLKSLKSHIMCHLEALCIVPDFLRHKRLVYRNPEKPIVSEILYQFEELSRLWNLLTNFFYSSSLGLTSRDSAAHSTAHRTAEYRGVSVVTENHVA